MEKSQKNKDSIYSWFLWWKLNAREVEKQVQEYKSLKIHKSYKGIASLLIIGSGVLTAIFGLSGLISLSITEYFIQLLVSIVLVFFIYRGKKWAIVLTMVLWTLSRAYSIVDPTLVITSSSITIRVLNNLLWWSLFMRYLYGAYKVERLRENRNTTINKQKETPKRNKDLELNKSNRRNKLLLVLSGLFLFSGWFYWFQYRPARIRHDCSWVRHYESAKPATSGKTEEELWQDGTLEDCSKSSEYTTFDFKKFCEKRNEFWIEENKPKPAQPEKEWYSEATKEEYLFCLHDKGLK